jgi:predicted nucleic acid-binding protein
MIIVDTSIWIEFFRGNEPHFEHVSELLERNDALALSPIFGELLQGARNSHERAVLMDFWNNLPKLTEDEISIRAGAESGRNRWIDEGVGLIDAIIVVAARETSSFVWTLDKKLQSLLGKEETYIPGK